MHERINMLDDMWQVGHALDDEVGLCRFQGQVSPLHDLLPLSRPEF